MRIGFSRFNSAIQLGDLWRRLSILLIASVLSSTTALAQTATEAPEVMDAKVERLSLSVQKAGRDAHSQTWNRIEIFRDELGNVFSRTNVAFEELQTGMHYRSGVEWLESRAVIESYEGGAVARHGQHKVIFAGNLNTAGVVDMETPKGNRLRSHVIGLGYLDTATGNSVFIGEIRSSTGAIVNSNQVIYSDAFSGVKADVRYTYTKAGFEQDIILRAQPPSPASLGLDAKTTRLQVFTEFLDSPQPEKQQVSFRDSQGKEVADDLLDFGDMKIGMGRAFSIGAEKRHGTRVSKRWVRVDGRDFLIEEVPLPEITKELDALPKTASMFRSSKTARLAKAGGKMPSAPTATKQSGKMMLAKLDSPKPGFVLDYLILNSGVTDYTFRANKTYLISDEVYASGTTTIEGGTVIKYSTYQPSSIRADGFDFKTGPYRPAIFTSANDNSAGQTITGSSGNPQTIGSQIFLYCVSGVDLRYGHVRFAGCGTFDDNHSEIWHSQFLNCDVAITTLKPALFNVLFWDCSTGVFDGNGYANETRNIEHVTADNCDVFIDNVSPTDPYKIRNCIFSAVGTLLQPGWGTPDEEYIPSKQDFSSSSGVCQSAGAGNFYLANSSSLRDAGSSGINSTLARELREKTTFPPVELTTISTDKVLTPVAHRDTDKPDFGYHYDPIDFAAGNTSVIAATVRVEPGTVLGVHDASGLKLEDGSHLVTLGTPVNPTRIVRYNTVQEQQDSSWASSTWGNVSVKSAINDPNQPADACVRFTDWSVLSGDQHFLFDTGLSQFRLSDSSFFGGFLGSTFSNSVVEIANSWFDKTHTDFTVTDVQAAFRNNLFTDGFYSWDITGTNNVITHRDNVYHRMYLSGAGVGYCTNAFISITNALVSDPCPNIVLSSFTFQSGPLGNYYQPTTSSLINEGTRSAEEAGLCRYTVLTSQNQENTSIVDIGKHYAPVLRIAEVAKSTLSATASSSDSSHPASQALDSLNMGSGWLNNTVSENPAFLKIDMGSSKSVARIDYFPPDDAGTGTILEFLIFVTDSTSNDPANWGNPVSGGIWDWPNGAELKRVEFTPKSGRFVILQALKSVSDRAACNEIYVYQTSSTGDILTPSDADANGIADYLECCPSSLPDLSSIIGLRVDIADSSFCPPGQNTDRQIIVEEAEFAPVCEQLEYFLAITVTGKVEREESGFDIVTVNGKMFFQGSQEFLGCEMATKTATRIVRLRPFESVVLRYDTVDFRFHAGAFAEITDAILVGVRLTSCIQ